MSGFSFGQPASTGTSTPSLFPTTSNTASGAGGTFGNSGSTASPFGANKVGGETPSLFGSNITGSSRPTTTLFGQTSSGTSNTFSFGKKAEETKTTEQPKTSFFGQGTSQPPATPGGSTPSLFGSTTPTTTTSSFSFAKPSTTPAGPPPQNTTFGASTGGGNIFGTTQNQLKADDAKQSGFTFGTATSTPNTLGGDSTAQSSPNLFPSGAPSTGGIFGAKPAASTSSAASIGATTTEAPKLPTFTLTTPSVGSNPATVFGTASTGTAPVKTTPQPTPLSLGSAQSSTTQPTTTGGFFSKTASTTAATPSLFGAQTQSATEKKPVFSFPTASTTTTNQTPASTGTTPQPLFSTQASTSAAPATSASTSGFKFPSTATTAPPSSTSASPGFSLGGTSNATSSTTAAPAAAPATTTTAAATPSLFSLGATTAPSTAATTFAPTATQNTNTTSGLGQSTLGASTSGPTAPAQSRLRNKTLDEILTRWATDLTRYTKDFKSQGETIAQWDQIIVDNSSKIDKLYIKTRTCEKQTMSVEMQLAAVENQQNELESWLTKYENDVEEMLAKDSAGQAEAGGPDQERERTYKLAEKLNERLDDMGRDLESMVEQVNAANASLSKHTKADEPITQIVRILNSHLTQLQQIDQGTAALQAKVASAQKAANHLGYLNAGAGAEGRAAVDDFYRSYMGRR